MTTLLTKHSTLILIVLVLAFCALAWLLPSEGLLLAVTFLLLSFLVAGLVVVQKHKELFLQGKTTRRQFLRDVFLELTGIGLVMVLAGLLGRYMAGIFTNQIADDLARFAAAILTGLAAGALVGILVGQVWNRGVVQRLHANPGDLK